MPLMAQYDQQGLMPLYEWGPAATRSVNLPYGGPTNTGGQFNQGQLLGVASTTQQNEVVTLTLGSTPSGTVTGTFVADRPYTVSWPIGTANAALTTLWQTIFGAGNVTVTGTSAGGTAGTVILTFGGALANQRIGGLFTATVTAGAATWARTTRGACAVQYDLYDQSANNDVDAILMYDVVLDPTGARVTLLGTSVGQPFQPAAFTGGFFDPTQLVGVNANAYTLGKLIKKAGGTVARLL